MKYFDPQNRVLTEELRTKEGHIKVDKDTLEFELNQVA